MAQEINLGGTIYISSKRAAEISGYAQDYVGQLARSGQIEARRVAGMWYVLEESVRKHKEGRGITDTVVQEMIVEQKKEPTLEAEINEGRDEILIDGKEFVAATNAAATVGYAHDYVTQLARSGKIPAHQIGTRWYVEEAALVGHKKEKDALLAAVQAESVGLARNIDDIPLKIEPRQAEQTGHFSYASEETDLLPQLQKPEFVRPPERSVLEEEESIGTPAEEPSVDQGPTQIPIRRAPEPRAIMQKGQEGGIPPEVRIPRPKKHSSAPKMIMIGIVLIGLAFSSIGAIFYFGSSANIAIPVPGRSNDMSPVVTGIGSRLSALSELVFAKELWYRRGE